METRVAAIFDMQTEFFATLERINRLSRGSSPCGCRKPLVSYRINRQLSGWILSPLMIRAFGAH
jgi:hypothetical protein